MMCFLGTRSLAVLFGALLFASPALAEEVRAGALVIDQAFSRATAGAGVPGVAYLRIRNTGAEPDRLLSASTPAAGQASLHASLRQGDVIRMRELTAIDVPPGTTVALSPEGRLHLMLEDLHARLRPGDTVVLTLRFERAGAVQVGVPVGRVGAAAPGPDHAGHAAQLYQSALSPTLIGLPTAPNVRFDAFATIRAGGLNGSATDDHTRGPHGVVASVLCWPVPGCGSGPPGPGDCVGF